MYRMRKEELKQKQQKKTICWVKNLLLCWRALQSNFKFVFFCFRKMEEFDTLFKSWSGNIKLHELDCDQSDENNPSF